jgi:hypothetical protein
MSDASDLIERMSREEYDRLVLHLGRYAMQVSHIYKWRTGNSYDLPGGHTVESIVVLAIEKAWLGERHWDREKQPDFKKYLMDVIDSLLYHLATGKDNEMLTAEPEPGTKDEQDWHTGSPERRSDVDWLVRRTATPEEELLEQEAAEREERQRDHAIDMLMEEARGDEELTYVIQAKLDGFDKAGEIAEETGIEVRDVYNIMKRLNRKIAMVRRRLKDAA